MMKVTAIVPAAGSGKRFESDVNKAFHSLLGKPVILYVFKILQDLSIIDEIIPVFKDEDRARGIEIVSNAVISKVIDIAPGGYERQNSVYNALNLIKDKSSVVLIHDGARPLVSEELITSALESLKGNDGVIPVLPLKDTIKEIADGYVVRTLDRASLAAVQTPQVFNHGVLLDAYDKAISEGVAVTDDASIIEMYNGRIKTIPGDYKNIKITTRDDADYAEFLLRKTAPDRLNP